MLSTSAEGGTCDIYANSRWISIRIPLDALAPMVADLDSVLVRSIQPGKEALSLLVSYIRALQDTLAPTTPELDRVIVAHVKELVALTVGATRDVAETARGRGIRAARLVKVLRLIEARIQDAGLSAAEVKQAVRKPWGIMPAFVESQLSDQDAADLAAYFATLPKVAELGKWRFEPAAGAP